MKLIDPTKDQLIEMMSWFSDEDELSEWAGPGFRYPYDLDSFMSDLNLDSLNSYSLVSEQLLFLAFGQYYLRLGKCHLGRLVVSPEFRGKGIASRLMTELSKQGKERLNVSSTSLFVLAHNKAAIKAYEKFGFKLAVYPENMAIENCLYMVKS